MWQLPAPLNLTTITTVYGPSKEGPTHKVGLVGHTRILRKLDMEISQPESIDQEII